MLQATIIAVLIAITVQATESEAFTANKQSLKGCHSNKQKIRLDSGSDGDLFFLPKGKDKPFPYLTRQVPKSWHMTNESF